MRGFSSESAKKGRSCGEGGGKPVKGVPTVPTKGGEGKVPDRA